MQKLSFMTLSDVILRRAKAMNCMQCAARRERQRVSFLLRERVRERESCFSSERESVHKFNVKSALLGQFQHRGHFFIGLVFELNNKQPLQTPLIQN